MIARFRRATPIRAYTDDGRNYIQWLIDAAATSLDTLREETGFTANQSPKALLYLFLRHALMLGYYNSSYNFHRNAGFLSPRAVAGDAHRAQLRAHCGSARHAARAASLRSTRPRAGSPAVLRFW